MTHTPLTKIAAPVHIDGEKVRQLAAATQAGLVATCGVPPDDLFQMISRFADGDLILDPRFGGVNRSRDACIVEIMFLVGRSDDQKRALYKYIVALAATAGFRPDDVMIALMENSRMDWSIGNGLAYADYLTANQG